HRPTPAQSSSGPPAILQTNVLSTNQHVRPPHHPESRRHDQTPPQHSAQRPPAPAPRNPRHPALPSTSLALPRPDMATPIIPLRRQPPRAAPPLPAPPPPLRALLRLHDAQRAVDEPERALLRRPAQRAREPPQRRELRARDGPRAVHAQRVLRAVERKLQARARVRGRRRATHEGAQLVEAVEREPRELVRVDRGRRVRLGRRLRAVHLHLHQRERRALQQRRRGRPWEADGLHSPLSLSATVTWGARRRRPRAGEQPRELRHRPPRDGARARDERVHDGRAGGGQHVAPDVDELAAERLAHRVRAPRPVLVARVVARRAQGLVGVVGGAARRRGRRARVRVCVERH
ncbi:hypothetical protein FA95DRAFT_1639742, partial [Auriscalpium vulgare]